MNPLPSQREVLYALYGAWRLARLDPRGLEHLGEDAGACLRSFSAALLVLPAHLLLLALHLDRSDIAVSTGHLVAVQALAYLISWTAFPVAMTWLAPAMNRADRLFGYITAYNWIKVVQTAFFVPVTLLAESGLLGPLGSPLVFAAAMAILFYSWFVTRQALQVNGPAAGVLVFLDLLLGVVITGVADGVVTAPPP